MKSQSPALSSSVPRELSHRVPRHLEGIHEELWPAFLSSNAMVLGLGDLIASGFGLVGEHRGISGIYGILAGLAVNVVLTRSA